MTAALARPLTIRPAPHREPPFDDEVPPALRLVGTDVTLDRPLPFAPPVQRPQLYALRRPSPSALPPVASWSRSLTIVLLEVLAGRRPVAQLMNLVHHRAGPDVTRRLLPAARARGWAEPGRLRSVHVCEPADGVAEVAAVVAVGSRVRAIAARVEAIDGRWVCTRLQLG